MPNLFLLLSALSSLSTGIETNFQSVLEHSSHDGSLDTTVVNNWNAYEKYLELNYSNSGHDDSSYSIDMSIADVGEHLNTYFSEYNWTCNAGSRKLISDVSGHIPNEMGSRTISVPFSKHELEEAIKMAEVGNKTDYGGCGPIAMLGVMDYVTRYLGYDELIPNIENCDERIALAAEVMANTHYSIFGSVDNSIVFPWDCVTTFNKIMLKHGMDFIKADYIVALTSGQKEKSWEKITENIDKGMPVSMFTGHISDVGLFSNHYANVYGYETWVGIPKSGGDRLIKNFVKARLNSGWPYDAYCDADILNTIHSGVVTYNIIYQGYDSFSANAFSNSFINEDGGGQYFFETKSENVNLIDGTVIQTSRLRCSYIENQYLVLSPNRENAGVAYLEIGFPHDVQFLSLDVSAWSFNEGMQGESFSIQYLDGEWINRVSFDPNEFSTKDSPFRYNVLFPKNTTKIRFYATHSSPSGNRNKGRICLDDFVARYN